jgi:hypothetical protein
MGCACMHGQLESEADLTVPSATSGGTARQLPAPPCYWTQSVQEEWINHLVEARSAQEIIEDLVLLESCLNPDWVRPWYSSLRRAYMSGPTHLLRLGSTAAAALHLFVLDKAIIYEKEKPAPPRSARLGRGMHVRSPGCSIRTISPSPRAHACAVCVLQRGGDSSKPFRRITPRYDSDDEDEEEYVGSDEEEEEDDDDDDNSEDGHRPRRTSKRAAASRKANARAVAPTRWVPAFSRGYVILVWPGLSGLVDLCFLQEFAEEDARVVRRFRGRG